MGEGRNMKEDVIKSLREMGGMGPRRGEITIVQVQILMLRTIERWQVFSSLTIRLIYVNVYRWPRSFLDLLVAILSSCTFLPGY